MDSRSVYHTHVPVAIKYMPAGPPALHMRKSLAMVVAIEDTYMLSSLSYPYLLSFAESKRDFIRAATLTLRESAVRVPNLHGDLA